MVFVRVLGVLLALLGGLWLWTDLRGLWVQLIMDRHRAELPIRFGQQIWTTFFSWTVVFLLGLGLFVWSFF